MTFSDAKAVLKLCDTRVKLHNGSVRMAAENTLHKKVKDIKYP